MNKEYFKTVLIVALFIVSLTLTQQLWIVLPIGESVSSPKAIELNDINIDVADILSPQGFVINFGGGNHTVFFAEPYEIWNISKSEEKEKIWIWKNVREVLKDYFSRDIEIEMINEEKWMNVNKFKSIRLDFATEIPGSSFIEILSVGRKDIDDTLINIDSLLIPTIDTDEDSIYFGNTREKLYLRIRGQRNNNKILEVIGNIETKGNEKGYISYYPLKDYISVNSDVLTPIFESVSVPIVETTNEIDVKDRTQVRSLANKFFGERFDFVKEIKEANGTIIYMYGYGEKALKINEDGLLEHIEQRDKQKTPKSLGFADSLKIAGGFVKEYIGWPVNGENAYLSYYEIVDGENKKGYKFGFNYRLKGLPVAIPNIGQNGAIEVEVIGDQVTYYKRIIKRTRNEEEVEKTIPFIIEVLDKNFNKIKADYIENREIDTEIENSRILELIRSIKITYYYDKEEESLIPAWEIKIEDMVYYFDLYNGRMVHSYKS